MAITPAVHDSVTDTVRPALPGEIPAPTSGGGYSISVAPTIKLAADIHEDGSYTACTLRDETGQVKGRTKLLITSVGLDETMKADPAVTVALELLIYRPSRRAKYRDDVRGTFDPLTNAYPRKVSYPAGFVHPNDLYAGLGLDPSSKTRSGAYVDATQGQCRTEWLMNNQAAHTPLVLNMQVFSNWFRLRNLDDGLVDRYLIVPTNKKRGTKGKFGLESNPTALPVKFRFVAKVPDSSAPTGYKLIVGPSSQTIYMGDPRSASMVRFTGVSGTMLSINDRHLGEMQLGAGFSPKKSMYVVPKSVYP